MWQSLEEEAVEFYANWAYAGIAMSLITIFVFAIFLIDTYIRGEYHYSILFFIFIVLGVLAFVSSYSRATKYEENRRSRYHITMKTFERAHSMST